MAEIELAIAVICAIRHEAELMAWEKKTWSNVKEFVLCAKKLLSK